MFRVHCMWGLIKHQSVGMRVTSPSCSNQSAALVQLCLVLHWCYIGACVSERQYCVLSWERCSAIQIKQVRGLQEHKIVTFAKKMRGEILIY